VAAQRKSSLSVRAFCAREWVTELIFYAWRLEIGVQDGVKSRPEETMLQIDILLLPSTPITPSLLTLPLKKCESRRPHHSSSDVS